MLIFDPLHDKPLAYLSQEHPHIGIKLLEHTANYPRILVHDSLRTQPGLLLALTVQHKHVLAQLVGNLVDLIGIKVSAFHAVNQ